MEKKQETPSTSLASRLTSFTRGDLEQGRKVGAGKKTRKKENKKPAINRLTHKIDATDQVLGRLATQIVLLLRGKNKATFQPHIDAGDFVNIINAAKIKLTGKKLAQKEYYHYSGYPGGLKTKKMSVVMGKDPAWALKAAVWNMLPKNKLRNSMIKRLRISN